MKKFQKIDYKKDLNGRQQENYNCDKASAVLADYGFNVMRLSDDWQGADFLANHIDGKTLLRVQLKGRFTLGKKYANKDIWLCFPDRKNGEIKRWYLCQYDCLIKELENTAVGKKIFKSKSYTNKGGYSKGYLGKEMLEILEKCSAI